MPNPTTLQVQQLEHRLAELELQLIEQYCQAGKTLLEVAERETRRVDVLVDKIVETRQQLSNLRHDRPCDGCGAMNSADSCFCRHCGKRQDNPEN